MSHVKASDLALTGGTAGIVLGNLVMIADNASSSVPTGVALSWLGFAGGIVALGLNAYQQVIKIREPSAVARVEKMEADALRREEIYKTELAHRDEARKELEARVAESETKCHRLEDQNTEVLKQLHELTIHVLEAKGFIANMSGEIPVQSHAPPQAPAPAPQA